MTQTHLDRLSSIDAGFLHIEDEGAHMHIGALGIFEGPPPSGAAFRAHIDARLPQLPRYRQKLQLMPLGSGRPLWVEDTSFRLDYHVRHTALPAPGGDQELMTLVNRVIGQRLDRTKPLWEMWLVEGLDDGNPGGDGHGRWAVICKTHHAMIDGVSGVDLLTVLFDLERTPPELPPPPPWRPAEAPGTVELLTTGVKGLVRNVGELSTRSAKLAVRPKQGVRAVLGAASALAETAKPMVAAAPQTPLNTKT
ncbi:MAG: acyltransferase, partial [Frankiales bacterium]|nr:acyltransferase [Frankiales bacterium]